MFQHFSWCSCLLASNVGMVRHFPTLQCNYHFKKMNVSDNSSPHIRAACHSYAGRAYRASTPLVWLLVPQAGLELIKASMQTNSCRQSQEFLAKYVSKAGCRLFLVKVEVETPLSWICNSPVGSDFWDCAVSETTQRNTDPNQHFWFWPFYLDRPYDSWFPVNPSLDKCLLEISLVILMWEKLHAWFKIGLAGLPVCQKHCPLRWFKTVSGTQLNAVFAVYWTIFTWYCFLGKTGTHLQLCWVSVSLTHWQVYIRMYSHLGYLRTAYPEYRQGMYTQWWVYLPHT